MFAFSSTTMLAAPDHATIGNQADFVDGEMLAQTLNNRREPRHVGGVTGPQEGRKRPVSAIQHDPTTASDKARLILELSEVTRMRGSVPGLTAYVGTSFLERPTLCVYIAIAGRADRPFRLLRER